MNEQAVETKKPGMVQAIAIMHLVNGILNILCALGWFITIIGIPLAIYCLIVGIMELVSAPKLLADPIKVDDPPRRIAVMEIINIISGSVNSLIVGILSLIFYNDETVKAYFASRKGAV